MSDVHEKLNLPTCGNLAYTKELGFINFWLLGNLIYS